tara:strand:- start:18283 stop:19629 length:1347 start_codon:yes stop_codon:yes gene_type:complete
MVLNERREFVKNTALLGGGLFIPSAITKPFIRVNDRILRVGLIGAKGMGWGNAKNAIKVKNVELVAICDVDQNVIKERSAEHYKDNFKKLKTYSDYRDILSDNEIDIVIIGTPDHWHCKMFCDAIDAGKHVYVEKPIALTIEECNLMIKAASKRPDLMVQVGQWQRSGPHYRKAIDIVQSEVLGQIRLVKTWAYQGWMEPVDSYPDEKAPEGVDYKMWLGPAPDRPFNKNRFHFNFRWFWDYAGGLMTDWGVHEIDIALYAMKANAPKSVMASGGKLAYPDDASETPDTLQAIFEYDNFNMLWEHATGIDGGPYGRTEGIAFIGNNGTLVVNRGGYEVYVESTHKSYSDLGQPKMESIAKFDKPQDLNYLALHWENFIEAIDKKDPSILNTPLVSGSVAAVNAMMGNIAYHTGRKIYWNSDTSNFGDDKEANALMTNDYHHGWQKPKV